jgi:hexosaminidase
MKQVLLTSALIVLLLSGFGQSKEAYDFKVKGFHLDLRIQVMTMDALKEFASKIRSQGLNTLIVEWEGTYPFETHPLIPNRYAYTREEMDSFIKHCDNIALDVIPLQQSFGHVEYILRHSRYKQLREDQKDYSQVCPLETKGDSILFSDLLAELTTTHHSKYIHIGGDETYLLGHDEKCKRKADEVGKSRLYIDYIRMICEIVIKLGKRPVLWADIALKYPEAIKDLPKETIFIDWNYGWELDRFGDHQALMKSGYEIWGSPSIRSWPDNYYITQWEKHFKNIRDFIPVAKQLGYSGMVITSWSTSGIYSSVFESDLNVIELHAIRRVYPLSGFNILVDAYCESLKLSGRLDIEGFITRNCRERFGFTSEQSRDFWKALKTTPYDVRQGEVVSPTAISLQQLADSTEISIRLLSQLRPNKNQREFDHIKLMADIRIFYLRYQLLEKTANEVSNKNKNGALIRDLANLLVFSKQLDKRFIELQKGFLNPSEIMEENTRRNAKVVALYERLTRKK